jgi:TetR/AcrR family transcriptional repressor of mexJK operon
MCDADTTVRPYKAGRPRKSDLDRRRAHILEVATRLFIEHGFAGATLEAIARAAGVGTRTLYNHYGDKEGLFRAIVKARTERTDASGEPSVLGAIEAATPKGILLRAAKTLLDICLSEDTIALERLMAAESMRFPEMTRSVVGANMATLHRSVTGLFEEMRRRGLLAGTDCAATAKYFIDLIVGIASVQVILGYYGAVAHAREVEEKVELFMLGALSAEVRAKL